MMHVNASAVSEKPSDSPEISQQPDVLKSEVRKAEQIQFGHPWAEQERILKETLSTILTSQQLDEEIGKQRCMFELYQDLVSAPDGRQLQLDRALAATPPEGHQQILEAAEKSWT